MKINVLWLAILCLMVVSCLEREDFPDMPSISYDNIRYAEVGGFQEWDTLVLRLNFEDGDGDLGLRADDSRDRSSPFNEFSLFSFNPVTERVTEFALDTLSASSQSDLTLIDNIITFSDRSSVQELDSLPDYDFPEKCKYYRELTLYGLNNEVIMDQDTVYYHSNLRYNNIYVRFLVETSPGSNDFEEFFFEYSTPPECNISWNGRFPVINEIGRDKSSEGVITYRMPDPGWRFTFQNNRIKLRVFIIDRAGHMSNVIETPAFRLDEIQR